MRDAIAALAAAPAAAHAAAWAVAFLPLAAAAGDLELRVQDVRGSPLRDAVVFLESAAAQAAVKPLPLAEIAQVARSFDPLVTVVPVGTPVSFPNRDTVRHHVYSFSPAKKFEIKLYVGTPAEPVVFDQPGIAVLGCNIHDQMAAWVVIVATPWYGKTGADGVLRLPAVPAGSYRLRSWHASLPVGSPAADQPLSVDTPAQQVTLRIAGARP
jgi:plastocyanin